MIDLTELRQKAERHHDIAGLCMTPRDVLALLDQVRDARALVEADNSALKKAEARLLWAEKMLKRADALLGEARPSGVEHQNLCHEWYFDLARGPESDINFALVVVKVDA
jgi:hypothetical protein